MDLQAHSSTLTRRPAKSMEPPCLLLIPATPATARFARPQVPLLRLLKLRLAGQSSCYRRRRSRPAPRPIFLLIKDASSQRP